MAEAISAPLAPSSRPAPLQQPAGRLLPLLTAKDRELIAGLQVLGIPRTAATCLVAITRYGDGQRINGFWLDRITDLRQPEVSIGTNWLVKEGILIGKKEPSSRKGRPVTVFHLACKVGPYLQRKVLQKEKELADNIAAIRALWPEVR